jgi:hypothetical protein
MDTETLYTIVHHIDAQLSKVELKDANKSAIRHLFDLRNNLLLTYRPDPSYDWSFKNKRLLKFFDQEVKWVNY